MHKTFILAPALLLSAASPMAPAVAAPAPSAAAERDQAFRDRLFEGALEENDGKIKRPSALPSLPEENDAPATPATAPDKWIEQPIFASNRALATDMDDARFRKDRSPAGRSEFQVGYDIEKVREVWGVNALPDDLNVSVNNPNWLAPGFFAQQLNAAQKRLAQNPDDKVALAQRAAAWQNVVPVHMSPEKAHDYRNNYRQIRDTWSFEAKVEPDLKRVLQGPIPVEAIPHVLKALELEKYAPRINERNDAAEIARIEKRVSAMKTALAAMETSLPKLAVARYVLDAKIVISRLYSVPGGPDKDPQAQQEASEFVARARQDGLKLPDSGHIGLLALAVEVAQGKLKPDDVAARAQAFKSPRFGADCASIALFLDELSRSNIAETWSELALTGDDRNDPHCQLAHAYAQKYTSRERFEALQTCALQLGSQDRYTVDALNDLATHASIFKETTWLRRALQRLVLVRGVPYEWEHYAQLTFDAREWAKAYNVNRLILPWQKLEPEPYYRWNEEPNINAPGELDPLPARKQNVSPFIDARLKGAFLMLKLGWNKASQAEYEGAIENAAPKSGFIWVEAYGFGPSTADVSSEFETTFILHRRFLRAELAKAPNDAGIKAALDRLVALKLTDKVSTSRPEISVTRKI